MRVSLYSYWISWLLKMEPISSTKITVSNTQPTPRNIQEGFPMEFWDNVLTKNIKVPSIGTTIIFIL